MDTNMETAIRYAKAALGELEAAQRLAFPLPRPNESIADHVARRQGLVRQADTNLRLAARFAGRELRGERVL